MTGEARLELTDQPDRAAVAAVEDGLAAFNEQQAGRVDARDLAVLIRDPETDETIGG